jgi:hypothetical protein
MIDPTIHHEPNGAPGVPDANAAVLVVGVKPGRRRGLADPYGLRALVLGWCMWLLISWSITLAIGATAHAVRWVVFSALVGLMGVWPALRLSQQLPGRSDAPATWRGAENKASAPRRVLATGLDWLCLMLVFQVVVWPLMVVGRWSVSQTLWLDVAIGAWSALTGVFLGLGRVVPVSGARTWAMMLGMLLIVGEPAAMIALGHGPASVFNPTGAAQAMVISPVQAVWELTTTIQPSDPTPWVPVILSVSAAAVLGWALLWGIAIINKDRG